MGKTKPENPNEYLAEFVTEMEKLLADGLVFEGQTIRVELSTFVCDAPARAYIKQIRPHNAHNGCERCIQEGVSVAGRMLFPEVNAAQRTDQSFKEQEDKDHHKGQSSLLGLTVGMVSQFVLDFMHLVCLGVMRKLIWF